MKYLPTIQTLPFEIPHALIQIPSPLVYLTYRLQGLKVVFRDNSLMEFDNLKLNAETSKKVFQRTGEIDQIIVLIHK